MYIYAMCVVIRREREQRYYYFTVVLTQYLTLFACLMVSLDFFCGKAQPILAFCVSLYNLSSEGWGVFLREL